MLTRVYGKVVAECDQCGNDEDTQLTSWDAALSYLRREGWTSEKVGDVWVNRCPECNHGKRSVVG